MAPEVHSKQAISLKIKQKMWKIVQWYVSKAYYNHLYYQADGN